MRVGLKILCTGVKPLESMFGKRPGKCILSVGGGFGILAFIIVILLETGADDYGRRREKAYQAGLAGGFR